MAMTNIGMRGARDRPKLLEQHTLVSGVLVY